MKGEQMYQKIVETAKWLNKKTKNFKPDVLIIVGSGLSEAIGDIENSITVPYSQIPNFPNTTVKGHKGELVFTNFNSTNIVIMKGRFHYYEGNEMSLISFPIRLMSYLGVKNVIVTAAVGSLKKNIIPGDIVLLKDHINLMGNNPLIGNFSPKFGEMFIDMNEVYSNKILKKALEIAKKNKIKTNLGVYMAVSGPSYETSSEVKMYSKLGADIIGMSVVPEVISAKQLNMNICGITWVSNFTTGISKESFDHDKVLELGKEAGEKIKTIIEDLLSSKIFE